MRTSVLTDAEVSRSMLDTLLQSQCDSVLPMDMSLMVEREDMMREEGGEEARRTRPSQWQHLQPSHQ